MKTKNLSKGLALAMVSIFLVIFSCKKKEDAAPNNTNATNTSSTTTTGGSTSGGSTTGGTPAVGSFTWTENGGAVNAADSAFWVTGSWGTGIRAYKGGFGRWFEINWANTNNTNVGIKNLISSNSDFSYIYITTIYAINSNQTLSVTAFATNKMSGNFALHVTESTTTLNLIGGFNAIPKK